MLPGDRINLIPHYFSIPKRNIALTCLRIDSPSLMSNSKYTQVLAGLLSPALPEKYISRGALYYNPIHITSFRNNVWKSSSFPGKFMTRHAGCRCTDAVFLLGFVKIAYRFASSARVDLVYK